jgi:hypothetical protein
MKKILTILILGVLFSLNACTELAETPYSIVTPENYGTTDAQLETFLGNLYTSLRGGSYDGANGYIFCEYLFFISAISSDEAVLPSLNEGADWYDGGRYEQLLRHTWDPYNTTIVGAWRYAYNGISTANAAISQIELSGASDEVKTKFINEIRAVRAWYYFRLLDWFGNVPIIKDYADSELPTNAPRADVYKFVEEELTDILDSGTLLDGGDHTRMTQTAAKCLLARLYLNAGVFSGTPQWQKCLDVCNTITGTLATDYFDNFNIGNAQSSEIIFGVPITNQGDRQWINPYMYDLLLHKGVKWTLLKEADLKTTRDSVKVGDKYYAFNIYKDPYPDYAADDNPICIQPGFYGTFNENDKRRRAMLSGQQYYDDGEPIYIYPPSSTGECTAVSSALSFTVNTEKGDSTISAIPLVYSDTIKSQINRKPLDGGIWYKYRLPLDFTWDHLYSKLYSNNFFEVVIFRYAEVLLTKAECEVRLSTGNPTATLHPIRERAGLGDLTPTLEDIENEWKFEFVFEDQRRTHMIRFNSFTEADKHRKNTGKEWDIKKRDSYTTLFPVPYLELAKNNKLEQNPGY